jgi:hypothetical protein
MNQERQNEADAKQIVEQILSVSFNHADTHGGVDYISTDGCIALEVTAVTDGAKKGVRDALRKAGTDKSTSLTLQTCWIVFVPDTQPQMKTFRRRVLPMIAELELAGLTYFEQHRATVHVVKEGVHSNLYRRLLETGVERAIHVPHSNHPDNSVHTHKLVISTGSGGSVSGSDEALARLTHELDKKTDNSAKLSATSSAQRHLFVWLDDDTAYRIARPLSRDAPLSPEEGWGLPTNNPSLGSDITHLWVVHQRTRHGWLWDGESWHELRDL